MSIQGIKRAIVFPNLQVIMQDPMAIIRYYVQLAQETVLVHNSFQSTQIAVAGLAGNTTVTLPFPYPDTAYSAYGMVVGWNAYAYIAAAGDQTKSTVKFTYSAAAPGPGGTLLVLTVR